ncbi:MAG: hypothetical protein HOP11_02180 [Saprospiraceae bacterium]|nr:hypothetical protein [Saprospiraceae bacterium]
MKKLLLCLGIKTIIGLVSDPVMAQTSKKTTKSKSKSKKKEENPFRIEKFWFGGGFNLQFYQTSLSSSVPGNIFEFGLSPLAGYKFTNWFTMGPRLEFNYLGGRFDNNPDVIKLNAFTYGGGLFARARFLRMFFAHFEYGANSSIEVTGISANNRLETNRLWQDNLLLGLGYNPEATWSYEFYIMYDFLTPSDSPQVPVRYRAGITWNF